MGRETIVRVYRHGQSEKNLSPDIVGGRALESPLTSKGVEQGRKLGAHLRTLHSIDAIYSSVAIRAVHTGMYAGNEAKLYLPIIRTPRLQELSHGNWEGRNKHEPLILKDGSTEWYKKLQDRGLDGKVSGSESIREVGSRMTHELAGLALRHSGEHIAVFSHASALRAAAVAVTGDPAYLHRKVPFVSETTFVLNGDTLRLNEDEFAIPTVQDSENEQKMVH